jgi:hypothetical protein
MSPEEELFRTDYLNQYGNFTLSLAWWKLISLAWRKLRVDPNVADVDPCVTAAHGVHVVDVMLYATQPTASTIRRADSLLRKDYVSGEV